MEKVGIVVLYDGEWKNFRGNKYEYMSQKSIMIVVSQSINYDVFTSKVFSRLNISRHKYDIQMKFNIRAGVPMPPIEITDDDVLQYFISENCGKQISTRTPLCVTFEKRKTLDRITSTSSAPETFECDRTTTSDLEIAGLNQQNCIPIPSNGDVQLETMDEEGVSFHDLQGCDSNSTYNNRDKNECMTCNNEDKNECLSMPLNTFAPGMEAGSTDNDTEIEVGQVYKSKRDLQDKIRLAAFRKNLDLYAKKSSRDLLVMKCADSRCKWHMRATKVKESMSFVVRRYYSEHSCDNSVTNMRRQRRISSRVLSASIKHQYGSASRNYKPKNIIDDIRKEYGHDINYCTAWRARKAALNAIKGSSEE